MIGQAQETLWDAIVIGTGIGGAVLGRALAQKGLKVLFVEQGAPGHRREETRFDLEMTDPVARRLRGFWPEPVHARIGGRRLDFLPPLGSGPGGSSVFYAATLERPEPHDLDHSLTRPHPTGGWPVSYDEMQPWFARAEALFHVCGTPDPLSPVEPPELAPPPALGPGDAALMARLRANGCHPYRAHAAIRYLPGCRECLGRKCPRACKMDARSAGLEPALATGRAVLVTGARVRRIAAGEERITHLDLEHGGRRYRLRARRYVLAAGALGSAQLALASACEAWPRGLANGSGLIGRGLMFHLNEMLAVWTGRAAPGAGPSKAVALRDLYWRNARRFGIVQAMGVELGSGEILHYLRLMLARSRWLGRVPGVGQLARVPAGLAARALGRAQVFVGLLEDLPDDSNRVILDPAAPESLCFSYDFPPELLARRRVFRRAMRRAFRGLPRVFLNQAPEPNFGHPCGTLRMGPDPARAVVDAGCRAFGLDNLWVADASVFPSSMGVNPGLTIAANALRVAEGVAKGAARGRRDDG